MDFHLNRIRRISEEYCFYHNITILDNFVVSRGIYRVLFNDRECVLKISENTSESSLFYKHILSEKRAFDFLEGNILPELVFYENSSVCKLIPSEIPFIRENKNKLVVLIKSFIPGETLSFFDDSRKKLPEVVDFVKRMNSNGIAGFDLCPIQRYHNILVNNNSLFLFDFGNVCFKGDFPYEFALEDDLRFIKHVGRIKFS